MAYHDVVMAGFGGQGLMAIGKLLAKAAMDEGRHVTWLPSYGPEMRGGTANCVVVVDDEPIGSPSVEHAQAAIVMNRPSLDKFEDTLATGGLLVINTSLIAEPVHRADLTTVLVPANDIAEAEGSPKAANMVMLGAYVAHCGVVSAASIEHAIEVSYVGAKKAYGEANLRAFRRGLAS
jgi:2-oxoglutarate ferredoxin oxidoreductase subunit gamma